MKIIFCLLLILSSLMGCKYNEKMYIEVYSGGVVVNKYCGRFTECDRARQGIYYKCTFIKCED